jgi:hypothetical protein
MFIEGKEVKVHKQMAEPRRCLKCQKFGHYVPDCKADNDTCARCKGPHRTANCNNTNTEALNCANCTDEDTKGHGAVDRNCPTFIKEKEKLQEQVPENKYKFFPSQEPQTWRLLNQPEMTMNEQQQAWQYTTNWTTHHTNPQEQTFMEDWQMVRR